MSEKQTGLLFLCSGLFVVFERIVFTATIFNLLLGVVYQPHKCEVVYHALLMVRLKGILEGGTGIRK